MTEVAAANRLQEQELQIQTLQGDLKERNEDLRILDMEKVDLLEKNGTLEAEVRALKRKENEKTIMTVSAASELEQLRERAKRMDHEKMEIIKQREKLEKFGELEAAKNKLIESNQLLKKSQLAKARTHKDEIAALEIKLNKMTLLCNEKNEEVDRLQFLITTEQRNTAELEKRLQEMHETHRAIVEGDKIVDCKKEFPELGDNAENLGKSLSLLQSLMESDDNDENCIPCIEESMISNIVQSDKTFCKVEDENTQDPQRKPTAVLTDLKNMNAESKSIEPGNGEVISFNQQLSPVKPSLPLLHSRIKQPKVVARKKLLPCNASTPARPVPPSRADGTFVIESVTPGLTSPVDSAGCSEVVDSGERRDRSLSRETKRVAKKDDIDFYENSAKNDQEDTVKVEASIPIADDIPPVQEEEGKPKPKRRGRKPKKEMEDAEEAAVEKTPSKIPRPSAAVVSEAIEENVREPATTTKKKAAKRTTQVKRKTKASTTAAKAKASRKDESKGSGVAIKEEAVCNARGNVYEAYQSMIEKQRMEEVVSSYSGSYASSEVSTSTAGGDAIKKTKTSRAKSKKPPAKGTPGRKTGRTKRTYVKTDSTGRASGEATSSHAQSSKKSTRAEEKTTSVESGKPKVENKQSINRLTAASESMNVATTTRRVTRSQRK